MDGTFGAIALRRDLSRRGVKVLIPERKRLGKRWQRGLKPKRYEVSLRCYKSDQFNA